VHKINESLETKQYCSAAFLDISQAFDKVWHAGLLHKLRQFLPLKYYFILKFYLHNRHFQVKVEDLLQPPLQRIQLSWPLTLIRPLPPTNYKPASLLFSIGLPNAD
jgi:hypothetical protein